MRTIRRSGQVLAAAAAAVIVASCFIDNPGEAPGRTGGTGAAAGRDAGDMDEDDGGPTLCQSHGGYDGIQQIAQQVVDNVSADCTIGAFFVSLTPDQKQHFTDCLTKQFAVVTRCPGIRYDVDSSGADCRDMKTSHHGLGIRGEDFTSFLTDMQAAFMAGGFTDDEWKDLGKAFGYLSQDIVTNSAPHHAKDTCDAGDGGP